MNNLVSYSIIVSNELLQYISMILCCICPCPIFIVQRVNILDHAPIKIVHGAGELSV
jgi:hypothetical protein